MMELIHLKHGISVLLRLEFLALSEGTKLSGRHKTTRQSGFVWERS
jgi:hypothetical protein